jgi:SAM-dependent methyltransferase
MTTVAIQRKKTLRSALNVGKYAYRNTRYFLQSMPYCLPRIVDCNICHWRGRHFKSDLWHQHSVCPYCRCSIRHRLIFAALEHIEDLSWQRIVCGRSVLHFAPERSIERALRGCATSYFSADCHDRRDLTIDISDMTAIQDATFDLLLACDVLEHVEHDRRALTEIHRVLGPGGWAIITVPQKDNLATTFEDSSIIDASERERVFGQRDHLRIYGQDFASLLETAGFSVKIVDETDFADEVVQRHVLFPPELSRHPLATNYRKVYFARKQAC